MMVLISVLISSNDTLLTYSLLAQVCKKITKHSSQYSRPITSHYLHPLTLLPDKESDYSSKYQKWNCKFETGFIDLQYLNKYKIGIINVRC